MAEEQTLGSLVEEFDAERGSSAPKGGGGSGGRKNLVLIAITVVALGVAGYFIVRQMGGSRYDPGFRSRERVMICSETGEVFERYRIADGSMQPWKNPKTGHMTLYPAEACYWTREGGVKVKPTYVLLNEYVGKEGQTICPDCGKRVVGHNPRPPDELMAQALEREKK